MLAPSSFADDAGLRHIGIVSALPSPPPSDSRRGSAFRGFTTVRLRYDLSICLPSLSELTGLSPSQRGLLLPGFRRIGHPLRRRIYLRWQLGKFHRRDSHPLALPISIAAAQPALIQFARLPAACILHPRTANAYMAGPSPAPGSARCLQLLRRTWLAAIPESRGHPLHGPFLGQAHTRKRPGRKPTRNYFELSLV